MTVGGIDHKHVNAGFHQQIDAFVIVRADTDRSTDAQLTLLVLAGVRMLGGLLDVFYRNQAAQLERIVDDDDALQAEFVHQALGFCQLRAFFHDHQFFARRHLGTHFGVQLFFETQIAVGDDTNHLLAFDHRKSTDAVLLCQCDYIANAHRRRNRDRIAHHT